MDTDWSSLLTLHKVLKGHSIDLASKRSAARFRPYIVNTMHNRGMTVSDELHCCFSFDNLVCPPTDVVYSFEALHALYLQFCFLAIVLTVKVQ